MVRYNSMFTLEDIDAIRQQHQDCTLDPRAWAHARGCSIETIRRVARGDTYINPQATARKAFAPVPPARGPRAAAMPAPAPREAEPTSEELAASFARLAQAAQAEAGKPRAADTLIAEMILQARGTPAKGGDDPESLG